MGRIVSQYIVVYCDQGEARGKALYREAGHDTAQGRSLTRCDTAALACDMAGGRPRHGTTAHVCAWPRRTLLVGWSVGCALGAPSQFFTQYTVSESLFGTLFMNTVHKIYWKKNEINFLKNKFFENKIFDVDYDLIK